MADLPRRECVTKMNERNLFEIDLGLRGCQFVARELADGHTFSRLLLENLDLASGQTTTHLPAGTLLEDALRFKEGGRLPCPPVETWRTIEGGLMIPTPTTRPHLDELILDSLTAPNRVAVFENASAARDDPWLQRTDLNAFFFGQEVYHLLAHPVSLEALDETVRTAQSLFLFVGALTECSAGLERPPNRGELTLDLLRSLARETRWIFVGAYDGEGYVIWRRRSSADTGQSPGPSQRGDIAV